MYITPHTTRYSQLRKVIQTTISLPSIAMDTKVINHPKYRGIIHGQLFIVL